jgi:hypothetical protein
MCRCEERSVRRRNLLEIYVSASGATSSREVPGVLARGCSSGGTSRCSSGRERVRESLNSFREISKKSDFNSEGLHRRSAWSGHLPSLAEAASLTEAASSRHRLLRRHGSSKEPPSAVSALRSAEAVFCPQSPVPHPAICSLPVNVLLRVLRGGSSLFSRNVRIFSDKNFL